MNLYKLLGLDPLATRGDIKRAYRKWVKAHHPDVNDGKPHPDHEAVQEAYEVLSDEARRAVYDETFDKPDLSKYNPDPEYLRKLIDAAGLSQRGAAATIGLNERTMRRYLQLEERTGSNVAPYVVQYALEACAGIGRRKVYAFHCTGSMGLHFNPDRECPQCIRLFTVEE